MKAKLESFFSTIKAKTTTADAEIHDATSDLVTHLTTTAASMFERFVIAIERIASALEAANGVSTPAPVVTRSPITPITPIMPIAAPAPIEAVPSVNSTVGTEAPVNPNGTPVAPTTPPETVEALPASPTVTGAATNDTVAS